jgi:hypothetical protein
MTGERTMYSLDLGELSTASRALKLLKLAILACLAQFGDNIDAGHDYLDIFINLLHILQEGGFLVLGLSIQNGVY